MKTILSLLAGVLVAASVTALADTDAATPAAAAPPVIPKMPSNLSAIEQLKFLRDQNVKILAQQKETLKGLEELEKTSQQLKAFGKRS